MSSTVKTRRHFTQAARDAAAAARRLKSEARQASPERFNFMVFVVRAEKPHNRFRWEIRRFGDLSPVKASADQYESVTTAMLVGTEALASLQESGSPN